MSLSAFRCLCVKTLDNGFVKLSAQTSERKRRKIEKKKILLQRISTFTETMIRHMSKWKICIDYTVSEWNLYTKQCLSLSFFRFLLTSLSVHLTQFNHLLVCRFSTRCFWWVEWNWHSTKLILVLTHYAIWELAVVQCEQKKNYPNCSFILTHSYVWADIFSSWSVTFDSC